MSNGESSETLYDIVAVGTSNPVAHGFRAGENVPVCRRSIRVNARKHHYTMHSHLPREWFANVCEQCVELTKV